MWSTKLAKNVNEITSISWHILRGAFVIIHGSDMEVYFEKTEEQYFGFHLYFLVPCRCVVYCDYI